MPEIERHNIIPQLHPFAVPIDSIQLDPTNARQHPVRNIDAIRRSLDRYGQRKPIIVNSATTFIEAGNGTFIAARDLGWTHVAAILVHDDPTTASGFAIADNRTAELAEWDFGRLATTIRELQAADEHVLGWQEYELAPLLRAEWQTPATGDLEADHQRSHQTKPIKVTLAQREVIDRAIAKVCGEENVTLDEIGGEGRALELICAEYLA